MSCCCTEWTHLKSYKNCKSVRAHTEGRVYMSFLLINNSLTLWRRHAWTATVPSLWSTRLLLIRGKRSVSSSAASFSLDPADDVTGAASNCPISVVSLSDITALSVCSEFESVIWCAEVAHDVSSCAMFLYIPQWQRISISGYLCLLSCKWGFCEVSLFRQLCGCVFLVWAILKAWISLCAVWFLFDRSASRCQHRSFDLLKLLNNPYYTRRTLADIIIWF